ncbi:MAG TPA: serine/threonine-protein kinase [Gemmatimonadales bacterium]
MPPVPEGLAAALSDRYRLERELGAGGMATVYLAEDLKHRRQVAIKVLRPDLAQAIGPERFLREVGIAARLSHPHIVGLIDSGEAAGFLYYVMSYIEGISLRQKLQREGELPIPEAVRILRDIAEALGHAHGQGVVHRDIKPENVMLAGRHALVMDFGVAKAVGEAGNSSALTSAGMALGTPAYMAPEQATGEAHVDHRADLYAWGIVAYELLAGQTPFVRSTPQKTLAAQATVVPEPVTHHRANVPGLLGQLVMRCLEKRPADRPQSAEELLQQLDQVLTPSGGTTPTATQPYQSVAARRAGRRRLLAGAGGVVALAVLGGAGWRWWQGRAAPIVADRVLVAPLEAEGTGFESAAERWAALPGAIVREGVGSPVAAATIRDLGGNVAGTPELADQLARRTGAGLVLRARCAGQGGDAACQLELFRRPSGALRIAATVRGDPLAGDFVKRLEDQALVLLLQQARWGDRYLWEGEYVSPSLEAVRADHQAADFFFAGDEQSLAAGRRAADLDTNWTTVQLYMATALPRPSMDSAMNALLARPRLPERQRIRVSATRAMVQADFERAYQLLSEYFRRADEGALIDFLRAALWTNRFDEVLSAAAFADSLPRLGRMQWEVARIRSMALHLLGRFQEQRLLSDSLKTRFPERRDGYFAHAIQAAAALGDTGAVHQLVSESAGGQLTGAGTRAWMAGQELMAHGHAAAGRAKLDSALAWYRRSRLERQDWGLVDNEFTTLEWLDRQAEAEALADVLVRSAVRPELRTCVLPGLRGRLAARAGRRADAEVALSQLEETVARLLAWPRERADVDSAASLAADCKYERATIAAALGDRELAARLLREARRPPMSHLAETYLLHRDPYFAGLWDYPPFRELIAPR